MDSLACLDSAPNLFGLFDTTIAPTLLYYSYIPIVIISLFFAGFIFAKNRTLQAKSLLSIALLFTLWIFNELVQWIATESWMVHFGWQMSAVLQISLVFAVVYFVYAFLYQAPLPFWYKFVAFILALPVFATLHTTLNMTSFDLVECQSYNGVIWYYIYALQIIAAVCAIFLCIRKFVLATAPLEKKQTIYVSIATTVLLGMFVVTNIIGDATLVYEFNLIGPVGMALFIVFLSYMVVKFGAFNIKLIATQALVLGLWALVFAILFIRRIENVRYVIFATLILLFFLGMQLIRSVKKEVKLRESLEIANEGQATLIHFINHQIKGFLNKGKIAFSELLTDSDYGPITEPAKQMLTEGEQFMTEGVDFVQQILRASDIEKGTFVYDMKPLDLKQIVSEVATDLKQQAESKGLKYEMTLGETDFKTSGDANQLREAVKNLITNSILYTPQGSISVKLEKRDIKALLSIKDTGVGLSDEVKPKLFTKGGRSVDSLKINVNSTGYGLAIVKGVVEAHKGRVWAESEGVNKGSTFYMELPLS